MNLLNELGKKCQAELEKQDVYLDFPEISIFQPVILTPSVSEFRPDICVNNLNVTNNLQSNKDFACKINTKCINQLIQNYSSYILAIKNSNQ